MDALLIEGPSVVQREIARAWLVTRHVEEALGTITLASHQRDAAARLLEVIDGVGGALLADEVGMGKTYTALAVARRFPSVLVVAPAALRVMWREALAETRVAGRVESFESLSRGTHAPGAAALVIVDEAHHARNPKTRRYRALARSTFGACVLLLSATPVHNRLRDLRAPLALFLGTRAFSLGSTELSRLIVRLRHTVGPAASLPDVRDGCWLSVPSSDAVVRAIAAIPPPVPPRGGGVAGALVQLGLLRAWSSSHAALRHALRGRAHRALAMSESLQHGRRPTRSALAAWTTVDDAVQLAFPELVSPVDESFDAAALLEALEAHASGVRFALRALEESLDADRVRAAHVTTLRQRHAGIRVVVFTQFARTAERMFELLRGGGGVAVITGERARIASGPVSRDEIVAQYGPHAPRVPPHLRVEVLIATDVLSEGLNLQGAGVVVHLDLPWTLARLEQRLGRLRRLGSPHALIHAYAIGPAPGSRSLTTVERTLRRKARLVGASFGSSVAGGQHMRFANRAPPSVPNDPDLTSQVEELRTVLAQWSQAQAPTTSPGMDSSDTGLRCAVVPSRLASHAWLALALARSSKRAFVASLSADGASEHPGQLLRVARLVSPVEPQPATDDLCLRAAVESANAWLLTLRSRELTAPSVDAPSTAHTATLQRIDALLASAQRHNRPALRQLSARCRTLVLAARGAGAEIALSEWLSATNETATSLERLHALVAALDGRVIAARSSPSVECRLTALLVLVRA